MKINAYHRAVLKDFADGDFAYLTERDEISDQEIVELGDTLLVFMLIELSESEDCENVQQAIQRLETARNEIDAAIAALNILQAAMLAKLQERDPELVEGTAGEEVSA